MSLEAAIADLTATVAANNELLSKMIARAESAKAPVPAAAAAVVSEEPRRRGRPPKSEQPKIEEDEDDAPPPKVEAKPEPKAEPKPAAKRGLTVDDIRTSVGGFMAVEEPKVREERKAFVKSMLEHFGVNKAIEIPEHLRGQAIQWVDAYAAGETVDFDQDNTEGDDDLMG